MLVLYNILMLSVLFFGFPLLLPVIMLSDKRRKTAPFRIGIGPDPTIGRNSQPALPKPLWIHALSVGETFSAVPLVKALAVRYGKERLLFSVSTKTGFEIAQQQLLDDTANIFFFPYDIIFSVRRRIKQIRPAAVIIVETDIWPNFLHTAEKMNAPVFLINARLSDRSFQGYKRFMGLFRPALSVFHRIGAQTASDAQRFHRLGVPENKIIVTGNIKFHQVIPASPDQESADLKHLLRIHPERKIVLAGSTHPEEEEQLINGMTVIQNTHPDILFIIAPRNPLRAQGVKRACIRKGLSAQTMTEFMENTDIPNPNVLVIDIMGALRKLYAVCDLAFVGGSLADFGGHNPLEPAAYAKPILFGPDMKDFLQVAEQLKSSGGAQTIRDAQSFSSEILRLIRSPETAREMGIKAQSVFSGSQGGLDNSLKIITDLIW